MSGLDEIREHMQGIGADGVPVGTVDHVDGERIKLTKDSIDIGIVVRDAEAALHFYRKERAEDARYAAVLVAVAAAGYAYYGHLQMARQQAIAIGLSEARKKGARVPRKKT